MADILFQYLIWHFVDAPKALLKGWGNFLLFYLDYFSIPLLLRTFFWHWHRYYEPYGKTFDPWRYFEAFVFNMMSRVMGVLLRICLIIIGIIFEIIIFFLGVLIFIGWFLLPLFLILGFIWGINTILS